MTDKRHEHKNEQTDEPQREALETVEGNEGAQAEIDSLKQQLQAAQAKAAENLDGWQRAQAEFINYKNRVQRDQEMQRALMKGDLLKRVLPVLDDLERALQNRPAGDAWADGLELVARKFQSILEAEGLARIPAEGQPFDPNFHEAISHEPADGVESGHVIEVVQNGYMLGDRVVRPAMVRVAR
jgi:molecular chaperone GrpE